MLASYQQYEWKQWIRYATLALFLLLFDVFIELFRQPHGTEKIFTQRTITIVTKPSITTFQQNTHNQGFEYELTKQFANYLGVQTKVTFINNFNELFETLNVGNADIAAASIAITPERETIIDFGPTYQTITQQVIYKQGQLKPRKIKDLHNKRIAVLAGTSYEETLKNLKQEWPQLTWLSMQNADIETIFKMINQGEVDYTIVDNHIAAIYRRFYPTLKPAFTIHEEQQLAWALPHRSDSLLSAYLDDFFAELEAAKKLKTLKEKFYGHIETFDYVGANTYLKHINSRLPALISFFKKAAEITDLDWRLLAAIGYQESHWDKHAKSPTGVRGIMMLTLQTAKQVNVDNRLDPEQSILGGARYIKQNMERLPERIKDEDRLWLALAAYNVGFGHLEDARKITQKSGFNPDRWLDVKKHLPLLAKKEWYSQTIYGYARGNEPVKYVENIRSYFDILLWTTNNELINN